MSNGIRLAAGALALSGLVACATPVTQQAPLDRALVEREAHIQQVLALRERFKMQWRLNRVSHPLLVAATAFCPGRTRQVLGFTYANAAGFPEAERAAAAEALGLGERLQVVDVVPGGPAQRAGLRVGDRLLAVAGRALPAGAEALAAAGRRFDQALAGGGPVVVAVEREGRRRRLELRPETACAYPVVLVTGDAVNAFADGRRVGVTTGMLRFVESDRELAVVVAHEIAHNAMGHMKKKVQNYALGTFFDILAAAYGVDTRGTFGNLGAQSYSKAFEGEADYVGLYIMARAGMDVRGTANFWRRMAAVSPGAIQRALAVSHPSTPERYLAIEGATREILDKRAAGRPLLPELKRVTGE